MTLTGNEAPVILIAYSLNGRTLALGSSDGTVQVWDTRTGEKSVVSERVYHGHILAIAFVSKDTGIAVCTADGVVRAQNISTGQDILHWQCDETSLIERASFSPDSSLVATGSGNGKIRVWRVDKGERILVLRGPFGKVTGIAFSSNGRLVASFSYPSIIRIWNSRTGLAIGDHAATYEIGSVAISRDGKVVAAGSLDTNMIDVWDLETPKGGSISVQNTVVPVSIAFSPDGLHLAAIGHDRIRLWNRRTGQEAETSRHLDEIHSAAYSPDGLYIASASIDGTIRIWNARSGRAAAEPLPEPSRISCVAVSCDNTFIVSGSSDGSVRVWDAQNSELMLQPLLGHKGKISSIAISSNGQLVASGSDLEFDGNMLQSADHHPIRLWHALTGETIDGLLGRVGGIVMDVAFSPDASQLASVSVALSSSLWYYMEKTVHVWNLRRRTFWVFRTDSEPPGFASIAFSPDGRLLAAAVGATGQVHIWHTHNGQPLGMILPTSDFPIRFLAFSSDGARLVTSTHDGTLRVSDISSGQLVAVHKDDVGESAYISGWVACSPDERFIARIPTEGTESTQTMRLWDAAAPGAVATVRLYPVQEGAATFASASHSIILGGGNKIFVW